MPYFHRRRSCRGLIHPWGRVPTTLDKWENNIFVQRVFRLCHFNRPGWSDSWLCHHFQRCKILLCIPRRCTIYKPSLFHFNKRYINCLRCWKMAKWLRKAKLWENKWLIHSSRVLWTWLIKTQDVSCLWAVSIMVVTEEAFIGWRCNGLIESVAVFAPMVSLWFDSQQCSNMISRKF